MPMKTLQSLLSCGMLVLTAMTLEGLSGVSDQVGRLINDPR